ncbi:hypothetical protein GCM10018962_36890 [Dactylosporangium matsuzakiense]|uniref:EAL domain-containing protein n=1 Tax=Dactylosporangium matsuzakiense TaxID=53360 RepID=A0A9W6KS51_9ACTN|nr:hypothetical protein GCM10017581_071670 [Dactylosporangium matsuzakiense]
MQAQDRPSVPPAATAPSPSVSIPAQTSLRPSSFRSRVTRTLASRNVLRARRTDAAAVGLEDDTVEVTPLGMLDPFGGAAGTRAAVLELALRESSWTIERILAERAVEPLFQPIVELRDLHPVGVEALARGPVGSPLWRARELFAAAESAGRLADLDTLCAERALETAAAFDVPLLFVNAEPAVVDLPLSERLHHLMANAPFRMVLEYTERALSTHPAALLQLAAAVQSHGHCLALDDVGADPMSLAFLPLLEPEVVKLDLQLLRDPHAPRTVELVAAVNAVAEQTGATIVAEGIETPQDLANARALGAHWGQGLLFGGPAPLPGQTFTPAPGALRSSRPGHHLPAGTPFEAAARRGRSRPATAELFAAHLEHVLRRAGDDAVVLARCTDADTARSWLPSLTHLAERAAFVGLVAPLHPASVGPGVRFALGGNAPVEECALVVVAPRYTAAVCGRNSAPVMEFAHTEDRTLVTEMARIILQQLPR